MIFFPVEVQGALPGLIGSFMNSLWISALSGSFLYCVILVPRSKMAPWVSDILFAFQAALGTKDQRKPSLFFINDVIKLSYYILNLISSFYILIVRIYFYGYNMMHGKLEKRNFSSCSYIHFKDMSFNNKRYGSLCAKTKLD